MGTHRLPAPTAKPAHGSPASRTLAAKVLVFGSMRCTAKGPLLATQTASAVMATQSAVSPNLMVAAGASSATDLGAAAALDASQHSAITVLTNFTMQRLIEGTAEAHPT